MCDYGTTVPVQVRVPPDLSYTGDWRIKVAQIDACIASLVAALQGDDRTATRASCCGHKRELGYIDLNDGRTLRIIPPGDVGHPVTADDIEPPALAREGTDG